MALRSLVWSFWIVRTLPTGSKSAVSQEVMPVSSAVFIGLLERLFEVDQKRLATVGDRVLHVEVGERDRRSHCHQAAELVVEDLCRARVRDRPVAARRVRGANAHRRLPDVARHGELAHVLRVRWVMSKELDVAVRLGNRGAVVGEDAVGRQRFARESFRLRARRIGGGDEAVDQLGQAFVLVVTLRRDVVDDVAVADQATVDLDARRLVDDTAGVRVLESAGSRALEEKVRIRTCLPPLWKSLPVVWISSSSSMGLPGKNASEIAFQSVCTRWQASATLSWWCFVTVVTAWSRSG